MKMRSLVMPVRSNSRLHVAVLKVFFFLPLEMAITLNIVAEAILVFISLLTFARSSK
jgi:hypothetical protein